MNLVFGLVILGVMADLVWAGFADPEGGPLGGLTEVFQGRTPAKRTPSSAGFLSSVLGTGVSSQVPSTATDTTGATVSGARARVLGEARDWMGTPYLWGGNTRAGVDCSGLTRACYATVGINLPRVSAAQALKGSPTSAPQAGDLVAFGAPVHHVGIYVGGGRMIHAPHPGTVVRNEAIWSGEPVFYRNLIDGAATPAATPPKVHRKPKPKAHR